LSLIDTFRILIPEFESLSNETVQKWLDLANVEVTKTGFKPEIREQIIVYLVADRMTNSFKQKGASGEVASVSEGSLSITYAKGDCSGYRQIYKRLVKAHTITPLTRVC
jgi:Protein of unknown function (DUF4054)